MGIRKIKPSDLKARRIFAPKGYSLMYITKVGVKGAVVTFLKNVKPVKAPRYHKRRGGRR